MGRVTTLLLLAAVAVAALATAADVQYVAERTAECWDCHSNDPDAPAPLRSYWNIIPAPPQTVTEAPVSYQVSVQNAWYHDIVYLEPVIDLGQAPSLKFFDGREPVDETITGAIQRPEPTVDGPQPPNILPSHNLDAPATGHVNFTVPNGATSMRITFQGTDPEFTPEITWSIYAGTGTPAGEPDFGPIYTTSDMGEVVLPDVAAFAGLGYGNWTVQGQIGPFDQDGDPNLFASAVAIAVGLEARFDANAEPVSIQSSSARLKPFATSLFTWDLQRVATPGPDEYVRIEVRGTPYYKHPPNTPNSVDYENVTKHIEVPVIAEGDNARLEPAASQLVVVTPDVGGRASITAISEAIGYAATFLIASSIVSGGVLGKRSRRSLNGLFRGAKRRVAFHNVLSYGLTATAFAHAILFVTNALSGGAYHWTLGLLWGGLAILGMFGLGITGALQVQIIRRWDYATWRWTHFALAMATILFTLVHLLLDGAHFGAVQEAIGWEDPLDPRA